MNDLPKGVSVIIAYKEHWAMNFIALESYRRILLSNEHVEFLKPPTENFVFIQ